MWAINGVSIPSVLAPVFATVETNWRPPVSTVGSSTQIAGRHGAIRRGLPVFDEPKLSIVAVAHALADQDAVEGAVNAFAALVSQPVLVVERTSGSLVTTAEAVLESLTFDGFRYGRAVTLTCVLSIPGVFWREDVQTSTPVVLTGSAADVTVAHLAGSTAPARGAVLRVTGPATSVAINEMLTGTGLSWAGSGLVAGQYLFIDVDRLRAWRSASSSQWTPGGTDVSGGLDYPAGGRLQLWPRVAPVKTEVRRNLIQNPRGTGAVAGWALNNQWGGSGGSINVTTENTPVTLPDGTQVPSFRRKTWTVTPSVGAVIAWQFYSSNADRGAVTAGQTYTVQYGWRKSFVGTPTINRFEVTFFDAVTGGTQIGFVNGATLNNPAPNVWQQDSVTFTVPVGATHVQVLHSLTISDPAILVPGVTFDATAAIAGIGGRYFDGWYRPAGYGSEWVGAANASASILYLSNPNQTTRSVVLSASAAGASGATALAVQAGRCFL